LFLKSGRLERTVCWHQIFLKLGENIKETFKTLLENKQEEQQIFEQFPKFKSGVTAAKEIKCLRCLVASKTCENMD
jgi:uncharacterized protein YktA (UPF0223 family)